VTKIREQLIEASKKGTFLETLYQKDLRYGDKKHLLGNEIVSLHNEGIIDVIDEFRQLSKDLKGIDFFLTRHVFGEALPKLNAPVISVMDSVKHLVTEAGDDMAAGMLFTPFTKYCEADNNRPDEVLEFAASSDDKWLDFIPPSIIAGSNLHLPKYVETAIELSSDDNIEIRRRAVLSLGSIDYRDNTALLDKSLEALKNVIESEYDDRLFGVTLKSAFNLYLADNTREAVVIELIQKALTHKEEFVLHSTSELFGLHTTDLPTAMIDVLIEALQEVNIENIGTLNTIDHGLRHLIKNDQEDKAVILLENLLIRHKEFSIQTFSSLTHTLYTDGQPFLDKLVTRWLLSRKVPLGKAVMDIIKVGHEKDIILSADTKQFSEQPEESCLFAARKAIGWSFTNPVSATSFIVSLIDISSDNEIEQITELLFKPLLISYSGKVKRYIESLLPNPSHKVQTTLTNALTKLDNYHKGLDDSRDILELLPSQAQRETYSRLFNRQMAASMKVAQKDSIFNLIASKSVLLYGRKSINYIQGPNEKMIRQEMPLQKIEHTIEYPRLEHMDPEGLDFMLRVFRVEGC
jgi:hypothetical protein